jgi:hypothetical protein
MIEHWNDKKLSKKCDDMIKEDGFYEFQLKIERIK